MKASRKLVFAAPIAAVLIIVVLAACQPAPTAATAPAPGEPTIERDATTPDTTTATPAPTDPPDNATLAAPPDGLVYAQEQSGVLWGIWMTRGGEARQVYKQPERYTTVNFDVLPAGGEMLIATDGDIWRLDLASGEATNATQTGTRFETAPRWLPDGSGFACGSQPGTSGRSSPTHLTRVTFDGGYDVLDDTTYMAAPPAPAPDGTAIAYVGGQTSPTDTGAFLIYRDGGEIEPFDPTAYGLAEMVYPAEVAWSPDGGTLAWAGHNGEEAIVALFDLAAGTHTELARYTPVGIEGAIIAPVWHAGGVRASLAVWDAASTGLAMQVYAVHDGVFDELATFDSHYASYAAFAPDGQTVAYASSDTALTFLDLATGTETTWEAGAPVRALAWLSAD